jgi:hypothetical protein
MVHFRIQLFVLSFVFLASCKEDQEFWESEIGKPVFSAVVRSLANGSCEAYEVTIPFSTDQKDGQSISLHGYPIVSGPRTIDPEGQKALQLILQSRDTYLENPVPRDCAFQPGVAFRFTEKSVLDILVCFKCAELRYYLNGQIIWQAYFKPKELEGLVKKILPKP